MNGHFLLFHLDGANRTKGDAVGASFAFFRIDFQRPNLHVFGFSPQSPASEIPPTPFIKGGEGGISGRRVLPGRFCLLAAASLRRVILCSGSSGVHFLDLFQLRDFRDQLLCLLHADNWSRKAAELRISPSSSSLDPWIDPGCPSAFPGPAVPGPDLDPGLGGGETRVGFKSNLLPQSNQLRVADFWSLQKLSSLVSPIPKGQGRAEGYAELPFQAGLRVRFPGNIAGDRKDV